MEAHFAAGLTAAADPAGRVAQGEQRGEDAGKDGGQESVGRVGDAKLEAVHHRFVLGIIFLVT